MKLYKNRLAGRFQTQASTPRCHRPQRLLKAATGAEAQRREPSPSRRQETWSIGGISYLNGIYTGVGEWGKFRAQTRAEAKGVGGENF